MPAVNMSNWKTTLRIVLILACSVVLGCVAIKGVQTGPRLLFESRGLLPSEVISQAVFIEKPGGFQIQPTEVLAAFGFLVTKPPIRIFCDGESYYFNGSHMTKISALPYVPGFGYKLPGNDLTLFGRLHQEAILDYNRDSRYVWEAWR
jgi:hypothetical protein